MKKKHGIFFGFAVIMTTAIFTLAGCGGDDDNTQPLQPPAAPGNLVITSAEGLLAASWDAVSGADSYEAMIDNPSDANAHHEVKSDIVQASVIFTGLAPSGVEYSIKVRAKNAAGFGGYSEETGTTVAATAVPGAPEKPNAAVEYNAITISWAGVPGATKYQFWWGTTDNSASARQYGGDITSGLSITVSVPATGTYYGWIKAGNSKGYSGFSPSVKADVTSLDPVIGTWKRTSDGGSYQITYVFKNDGTLEATEGYVGASPDRSNTYTYDSATKRIYYGSNPPRLFGTYSVSGGKLSVVELDSSYTRQDSGSGLTGTWRRSRGVSSYEEFVFTEERALTIRYVENGQTEEEEEYSYTVSGNKLTYMQEIRLAQLSGSTLNVYMNGSDPVPFTRSGGGSGLTGTWTASYSGQTIMLQVTSNKITVTQQGSVSGEFPCRISGNDLYFTDSWEYTYSIDTSASPQVLTFMLTREYDRVN